MDSGADVNAVDSSGDASIHIAAMKSNPKPAQLLLEGGANANLCNASGESPLHVAVRGNSEAVLASLLDHDAVRSVLNAHGLSALDVAIKLEHTSLASLLIDRGCTINFFQLYYDAIQDAPPIKTPSLRVLHVIQFSRIIHRDQPSLRGGFPHYAILMGFDSGTLFVVTEPEVMITHDREGVCDRDDWT